MLSASNEANWTGPALNMARPAAVESHLAALGLRRHPEMTAPHKRAHRHYPAARTDERRPRRVPFLLAPGGAGSCNYSRGEQTERLLREQNTTLVRVLSTKDTCLRTSKENSGGSPIQSSDSLVLDPRQASRSFWLLRLHVSTPVGNRAPTVINPA